MARGGARPLTHGRDAVPRELLVPIIEDEIAKRHDDEGVGGVERTAHAIAQATGMTPEAVTRRLSSIRHPEYWEPRTQKRMVQEYVTFRVADAILTGLERQDEWHTTLADVGWRHRPVDRDETPELTWCKRCHEWTLGRVCLWCDSRTLRLVTMVERNERGDCELCGADARSLVGGHRLCNVHAGFWTKLGEPVRARYERELAVLGDAPELLAA